jgi:hypothetical protein
MSSGMLDLLIPASFGMQISSILLFWILSPLALGKVSQCRPSACLKLFSLEFDESKLFCNASAAGCRCSVKVLDLLACVADDAKSHIFDLTISRIQNLSSNDYAYTAECRASVLEEGACILKGIKDSGFQITLSGAFFAALSVVFELLTAYQVVSVLVSRMKGIYFIYAMGCP